MAEKNNTQENKQNQSHAAAESSSHTATASAHQQSLMPPPFQLKASAQLKEGAQEGEVSQPSSYLMASGAAAPPSASAIQMRPDRTASDAAREQHDKRGQDNPYDAGIEVSPGWEDNDLTPPEIAHDHGFLDDGNGNIDESKREDPTWTDRLNRLKWIGKLEAAEALRPDLIDGTRAYRHFLYGGGADYSVNYERFIAGDSSGATALQSAIEDTMDHAIGRHDDIIAASPDNVPSSSSFQFRSDPITVGGDNRYPYPATENWQKAIGGHSVWIEADVSVEVDEASGTRTFSINMTLHAEDRYNFNPSQQDIATGIPDSDNGRFEITGLGHEFMQRASVTREIEQTRPFSTVSSEENDEKTSDTDVDGGPRMTPRAPRRAVAGGARRRS